MNENWSNNRFMLNGRARPPIVLRSDAELLIAQNAHNLIWEKHRGAYDALAKGDEPWTVLCTAAQQEIDALIIAEITAYREERANRSVFDLEERIEQLEQTIDELRALAEEAQSTAEEVLDTMEDALDRIESADEDSD